MWRDASRRRSPRHAGDPRGINGPCDVGQRHERAHIATCMTPGVGHVVRMVGGPCAPGDMGGGWVCRVWGQAASRTWPADTTRLASQGTPPGSQAFLDEGEERLGKGEERFG